MKKVLFISAVAGFLNHFEKNNVRILQEMGYEVHFASNKQNVIYHVEGMACEQVYQNMHVQYHDIPIKQSPFDLWHSMVTIKKIIHIIKQENIQVVHCSTPNGGMVGRIAAWACREQGIHVIYYVHGFHFSKGESKLNNLVFRTVEKFLARGTDVILTINQEDYEAAQKFCLRTNGRVYHVPGVGVDMEYYQVPTVEERSIARKQLGVTDKFFIVSVGEIRSNKNQTIILQALEQMKQLPDGIQDILYGLVGEEKEGSTFHNQVQSKELYDNVKFFGYQTDIRNYLAAADMVAFPSIREGLGMAALESLAMGVFVVAGDNRGSREYIIPEVNGVRIDPRDVNGFISAIQEVYSKGKNKYHNYNNKLRIRETVQKFSVNESKRVLRGIYDEVFS